MAVLNRMIMRESSCPLIAKKNKTTTTTKKTAVIGNLNKKSRMTKS